MLERAIQGLRRRSVAQFSISARAAIRRTSGFESEASSKAAPKRERGLKADSSTPFPSCHLGRLLLQSRKLLPRHTFSAGGLDELLNDMRGAETTAGHGSVDGLRGDLSLLLLLPAGE